MKNIKLNIDGTDYDFETHDRTFDPNTPRIIIGQNVYIGKAIPKEKDIPKSEYEVFVLEGNRVTAIKRLSDGEIFKVGEVDEKYGEIIQFPYIDLKKEHYAMCDRDGQICYISIPFLKKVKPKVSLFTTADGKDCCEEDKFIVYFISKDWQISATTPHYAIRTTGYSKIFFDKEKAKEYILQNKKVEVSYKELQEFFMNNYNVHTLDSTSLQDFFKSKINP